MWVQRQHRFLRWRMVVVVAALSVGSVGAEVAGFDGETPLDLRRAWRFQPGDDLAWSQPDFDDRGWVEIELASWGRNGFPDHVGVAWYRLTVNLARDGSRVPTLGVSLGKIASSYELYAGGRLLGGVGGLPPNPRVNYDEHRVFELPGEAIGRHGRLVLALRVWGDPTQGGFGGGPFEGAFLLGPLGELERRAVLVEVPALLLSLLFVLIGLHHLYLHNRGYQERSYLWFGFLAVGYAAYTFLRSQWKFALGLPFLPLKELEFFVLYSLPAITVEFFWSFLDRPVHRWLRFYQVATVGLAFLVALTPGLGLNLATSTPWQVSLVPVSLLVLGLVLREARRGRVEAKVLLPGVALLVGSALNDIGVHQGWLGSVRLGSYGFAAFLLAMMAALAERFGRLHREVTGLRERLEEGVRTRTAELEVLYELSRAVNREVDLEAVMEAVVHQGLRLVPRAERGVFLLHRPGDEELMVIAEAGAPGDLEPGDRVDSGEIEARYRESGERGVWLGQGAEGGGEVVVDLSLPGRAEGRIVFSGADPSLRPRPLARYRELALAALDKAMAVRALRRRRREAEQANRAKSNFLATMSHELRSPLNSIIGFSEILLRQRDGEAHPRSQQFVGNILASGKHLLSLINDILDLSKIESGKTEVRLEPVAMDEIVSSVCGVAHGTAVQREIEIRIDVPQETVEAHLDRVIVKQILWNLLSNALKFSPPGSEVDVRLRPLGAVDSPLGIDAVALVVTDRGIGIAPEDQERIFEAFQQAETVSARRFEGTGLGLALVKHQTDLLGGLVEIDSALGEGSTFRVVLPVRGPV